MKRNHQLLRSVLAGLLALLLLLSAVPAIFAGQVDFDRTAAFLASSVGEPTAGDTHSDWGVFAMVRAGIRVPNGYYAAYVTRVEKLLQETGGKLPGATSNNLRLAMTLTALGQDLTDIGGSDLMALVKDTAFISRTAVMGPAFALILLNSTGGDRVCEQAYLRHLLDRQLSDGGWDLSSRTADPDATAMVLQALSLYRKESGVEAAIQKGVACLSRLQKSDGSFTAWNATTSESISQTIIALCMLDIPLTDSRFVKNGNDLLSALLTYRLSNGSFCHTRGDGYDAMATQQAMLALDALRRESVGLPGIYEISDKVKINRNFVGLPGKHKAISVPALSNPSVTFSDISACPQKEAILALARRGILNGMDAKKKTFEPNGSLTRAQFCAMTVRGLSLPAAGNYGFTDVKAGDWYYSAVNSAAAFGAVNGVGSGKFAPDQTITRQEAATLIARLAKQCGLTVNYDTAAARNVLAQFSDYRTCADWALEGLAFCYDRGLLDDSTLNIRPTQAITRAEAAQMFYSLLDLALLLEG